MNPNQFFSKETKDRLRAALERLPINHSDVDIRVRVMLSLGFRPEWVIEWFPEIPLKHVRAYFKGISIRREHREPMERAAWRVIQAAQEMLIESSLEDQSILNDPKWMELSRRIRAGAAALSAGKDTSHEA